MTHKRLIVGLCLLVSLALLIGIIWGRYAVQNAALQDELELCSSASTISVNVYYRSIATNMVVFDLQDDATPGARRIDPVHLLFQFGSMLNRRDADYIVLARKGRELFSIGMIDFKPLCRQYEKGTRMYAMLHLPPKLSRVGRNGHAFQKQTGSGLYALQSRTKVLNRFIEQWTGY